jgi:acyl-CoA reductase-like NAD-dependent aldehyde dehydrogenase
VGPLINAAAVERVCGMLDRARRDNAGRIVLGGVRVGGALAGKNLPHTPFGGLGISGYGKEGGRAGIDEFLCCKTVSIIEPS